MSTGKAGSTHAASRDAGLRDAGSTPISAGKAGSRKAPAATGSAKAAALASKTSARERLLDAANELFYDEGVQTVGIDRVIEQAGVAKASLYNTFGSKEQLVYAYLQSRHESTKNRITRALQNFDNPRDKLLGIFESQHKLFKQPKFHGCAFMSASAESRPGGAVEEASDEYREWMRSVFTDLAAEAGAADPQLLGRQLHLLYDGSILSARMDRDPSAALVARQAAAALLDASIS
ncbi:MAG: TetR family transcriptional regulator [Frankiales bacterium]|nr:TetR family transcriptional regulator [Frankiales bacterium]